MPAPKKFTEDDKYTVSSRRQSAKEVRAKASGKTAITFVTKKEKGEDGRMYSTSERDKSLMLKAAGKAVIKPQTKKENAANAAKYEAPYTKGAEKGISTAKTKTVNSDAYDTLGRLADNNNLKGKARDKAIKSALKVVAQRMQSDRNRTATRAESVEKRAAAKKAKSNKSKLIGG
jgi:hypothetical protein